LPYTISKYYKFRAFKMTKILFINPNTMYLGQKLTVFPPMGILYISSMLLKAGYDVKVVDADTDNLSFSDIQGVVSEYRPKIIGITMNTLQSRAAFETAEQLKKLNDLKIVVGGPHPSALKGEILKRCEAIDAVVFGEGEMTFLELAKAIEEDRGLDTVKGVCFREDDEIRTNEPREPIADLDQLPFPALHLLNPIRRYPGAYPVGGRPSIQMMASRGCPFQCIFCSNPVWEKRIRLRSPESILSEVKWLRENFKVREVFFQDDTFNIDREWFEAICIGLIEMKLSEKIVFKSPFRANERLVDLDLLKLAKKAGFWMIFYGVESGNQTVLDIIKKNLRLEELVRAFRLTRKAGIKTYASFMVGNPGENRATVQDTINFAKKIDPDYYGFAIAMPYPGSEFYRIAKESGWLKEDVDDYNRNKYILNTPNFGPGEVEELVRYAYESLEGYRNSGMYKLRKNFSGASSLPVQCNDYFPALEPPEVDMLDEEIIMGENDWDVLGPGWYAVENWPPRIRWTGKLATAYLKGGKGAGQLCVRAMTGCEGLKLRVSAGNTKAEAELKSSQWTVLRLSLNDQKRDPRIKVEIEVNRTYVPDEIIKNGDMRSLGVAVQRIWLESTQTNHE